MTEVEQLVLEVTSRGAADVNRKLDEMDKKTKTATGGFKNLATSIAALYGAAKGLEGLARVLIKATQSYQDYNAQLLIATGSQKNATEAMDALVQFATRTPYSVSEATDAFIKLKNLGMDPSEKAMYSFGNTAKSQRRSLIDFVQAVASATTGEYDALKSFGIKTVKENDKITFTFQNQRTTIQNNAQAIEKYMQSLGDKQFAGAMEASMKTLTGSISNLGDAWDQMWISIAKQGPDSFITKAFQQATAAVTEFKAQIDSGQLQATLGAWSTLWGAVGTDIRDIFTNTGDLIALETERWEGSFRITRDDWKEIMNYFPLYARAAVGGVTGKFMQLIDDMKVIGRSMVDTLKNSFNQMVEYAGVTATAIAAPFKGNYVYAYGAELEKVTTKYKNLQKTVNDTSVTGFNANDDALEATQDAIDVDITSRHLAVDAIKAESAAKREAFNEEQARKDADKTDRLAKYRSPAMKDDGAGSKSEQSAAKAAAKREATFQNQLFEDRIKFLQEGLTREGQVIASSYEERKKVIEESTKTTEQEKKNLILQALAESVVSEETNIKQSYDRRKEFILSATGITEAQKTELMMNLTRSREEAIHKVEAESMNKRLDQASSFFGNIASIGSTFGKKGFKIAQAAAIAQATIDTYKAATGAYASLSAIPYVGPALGIAAAAAAVVAGAANIAKIKSQTYQGAYAQGGMISAGKYGLVGERGPEYVQGPAIVTSAQQSARQGGDGGLRTVTVMNHGQPVEARSERNGDELLITLLPLLAKNKADTKAELATEIHRGGSPIAAKLEQTYGLRRSATT